MLSFEYICHQDQVDKKDLLWFENPELSNSELKNLEESLIKSLKSFPHQSSLSASFFYDDQDSGDHTSILRAFFLDYLQQVKDGFSGLKSFRLEKSVWSLSQECAQFVLTVHVAREDLDHVNKSLQKLESMFKGKSQFDFFYINTLASLEIELRVPAKLQFDKREAK